MTITITDVGEADKRKQIIFDCGDVKLSIVGYDMLPHKIKLNGHYERIEWEEFRQLVTSPEISMALTQALSAWQDATRDYHEATKLLTALRDTTQWHGGESPKYDGFNAAWKAADKFLKNASLERAAVADTLEDIVRCENCGGSGVISYNPNLNPNAFPATASAKCTRCGGTGIEDTANE